jgi:hypothetical protein
VPPKLVRHENRLMLTLFLADMKTPSVAYGVATVSQKSGVMYECESARRTPRKGRRGAQSQQGVITPIRRDETWLKMICELSLCLVTPKALLGSSN